MMTKKDISIVYKEPVFKLPILGQERYLKGKSSIYGWIVNEDYVIAFFLQKMAMFKRLVFTTGLIVKNNTLDVSHEKEFLNQAIILIKEMKLCDFIYKAQSNVVFNTYPDNSDVVEWGSHIVNLQKKEEELFNSFSKKSRNVIRKAIKNDVVIKETKDTKVVFNNIKETLLRYDSIHYPSLDYLDNLVANVKDNILFLVAEYKGAVQGSLVVVYDNNSAYVMYAGSLSSIFPGSIDLLHFTAMKIMQNRGVHNYDFVGTRINFKPNSKHYNLARFKKRFSPDLKKGYAFKTIINTKKYLLFSLLSKIYFYLKGYKYTDPITQIKKDESKLKSILLLGPCFNKKDASLVGGSIVLFEDLLLRLQSYPIEIKVIDTNKANYPNVLIAYIKILVALFKNSYKYEHISLHSSRDYILIGGLLVIVGKIFRKRLSLRKFGGEAKKTYETANKLKQLYLKFIFSNMDMIFLETKYLVEFIKPHNKNTFWFPNVRSRTLEPTLPRSFNKKFVFISHISKMKGITEILEAAKSLDTSYTIDVYGPILNTDFTVESFVDENINYKGALQAHEVRPTLNEYDVVLLPSYKEGYPGIIIEAYSLGLPVITTKLPSIKEIVSNYETGVLVEPKNSKELKEAILSINTDNYTTMSKNAYDIFQTFDSDSVTKQFIDKLEECKINAI